MTAPSDAVTPSAADVNVAHAWLDDLEEGDWTEGTYISLAALLARVRQETRQEQHAATREACAARIFDVTKQISLSDAVSLRAAVLVVPLEEAPCPPK